MLIRVTLATSYSFAAKTRLDVLRRSLGLGTREPASPFYSILFYARQPNRREWINLTTYRFASFGATLSDRAKYNLSKRHFSTSCAITFILRCNGCLPRNRVEL